MAEIDELLDRFLKFEKEHSVFDLQYGEIYYWHLIRSWLFRSLLKGDYDYDDLDRKRGNAQQVLRKTAISMISCFINLKQFPLRKNQCDILFSSPWNLRLVNGKSADIFVGYLELDKKYITRTFEYNDSIHISSKRDISSCFIDLKMMLDYLKFIIKKRMKKDNSLQQIEIIINSLNKKLGVDINAAQIKNRIRYSACVYQSYYRNIQKYLVKIEPKSVIMTNAYGLRQFATIRASKELGIKTIELQHGLIGQYHVDYNFAEPIGSERYCPDYLFTFGEYWSDTCRSPLGLKKIAVGNRYIEHIEELNKDIIRDHNAVVFYSMKRNDFADFACKFADLVKDLDYKVIFKYHPVECGKADYAQLKDKKITIIDQPTEVHDFLTRYEHHVSVGSTVLFEGAMRGASIYVWDVSGKEFTNDLTNNGYGQLVKNEHDLFEQIVQSADNKNTNAIKRLLTPNANENINKALEIILNGEG